MHGQPLYNGLLPIRPSKTYFKENLLEIQSFSFRWDLAKHNGTSSVNKTGFSIFYSRIYSILNSSGSWMNKQFVVWPQCVILTHWCLGECGCNHELVIFKPISDVDICYISCEIAHSQMPQHLTDDQSKLVQVLAWCHMAPSHYLHQCWPRSMSPYGVTRPQWVNLFNSHILYYFLFIEILCNNKKNIPWGIGLIYISWEIGQHHDGYWCPGSLHHQAINSHGIDHVEQSLHLNSNQPVLFHLKNMEQCNTTSFISHRNQLF